MDLVENGHAMFARDAQADLNQWPAFDALFVFPILSERALPAVEVSVRHIIDDALIAQGVAIFGILEYPSLQSYGVKLLKGIHSAQQASLRETIQTKNHVEISSFKPTFHFVYALVVNAVGIDQTKNFWGKGAQSIVELDGFCQMIQNKQWAAQLHLFNGHVREGCGYYLFGISFFANIPDMALNNPACNSLRLDFSEVNTVTSPDFPDE